MDIILSKHFKLSEFLASDVATSHRLVEQFQLTFDVVNNLCELVANVLEPIRARLDKPIRVTSGYRCSALNRLVGGVDTSQHLYGMAADISSQDNAALLSVINGLVSSYGLIYDQLILYGNVKKPRFIHVSFNPLHNRHQLLYKL